MHHLSLAALSEGRIFAAYFIFLASYFVFAVGKFPGLRIDRPGAAIIGAVAMAAFRIVAPDQALQFINFPTIVLLFSMMLIVANLHLVGFFEWSAELVLRRIRPPSLLPAVVFTSGIFSAFFVNDIVCLVMVPFILSITRRLQLQPTRYLLALATASNIGSVATITGNPQNMLIGSFSGISYREFMWRLGPVALIGLFLDWLIIHLVYKRKPDVSVVAGQQIPLPALELSKLTKPGIVVLGVVIGFFAGAPPAIVAALGAAVLLITRTLDPRKIYQQVDWGLLVFFVGLFLIVGGAENAGLVGKLLAVAAHWNLQHIAVFTVTTAVMSNIVSNVPAVMLLKSVVLDLPDQRAAWLTLAMATTLAGNLTITGSVANIIVVESARPEVEIGFREYVRAGLPITVVTMLVGWAWLSWM
jgi:Na+/H+ antiporter NhaD/arsenite permease-like protein